MARDNQNSVVKWEGCGIISCNCVETWLGEGFIGLLLSMHIESMLEARGMYIANPREYTSCTFACRLV